MRVFRTWQRWLKCKELLFVLVTVLLVNYLIKHSAQVSHRDSGKCDFLQLNHRNESKYVSLCNPRRYGAHRMGNHLFMLAAMIYVAKKTGRTVILPKHDYLLDTAFKLDCFDRFYDAKRSFLEPSIQLDPVGKRSQSFDERFVEKNGRSDVQNFSAKTLLLCGLYQTSLYASIIEPSFRKLVRFRPEVQLAARMFLHDIQPQEKRHETFFRVGIHVRRGDFLKASELNYGLTVIDESYLGKSMVHFMQQHAFVHFIITTDDPKWVQQAISNLYNISNVETTRSSITIKENVIVMISFNKSAAVDLAILSQCDAVIMSTGSFGWWAAWLANKETIYYEDWPRSGSVLDQITDNETYFPKHWIPMK